MTSRLSISLLMVVIILIGCTPGQPAKGSEVGSIVPIGQPEIRDLSPTTETVPNCSGGNTPVTKHPSMTVATSYAIEWEIGGEAGVGVTIGEGAVPGGVSLEGALNGAISNGLDSRIEQSSAWDLSAEPNTIREYTIMWREVWQPGYVNIILPTGKNIQVNVVYRSGIQSDIIGDKLLNCDGNGLVKENPSLTVTSTESETTIEITPLPDTSAGPQCFRSDWESCWRYDDTARTMTWIGPTQDSFDIGQKGISLEKIRDGYTAVFSIRSSGTIDTCVGSINGQEFTGDCPIIYEIQPGDYRIVSPGPSGGFRVSGN